MTLGGAYANRNYATKHLQDLKGKTVLTETMPFNHASPYPRYAKQCRNLFEMQQAIQEERIGGFRDFTADVKNGTFPGSEHIV